MRHLSFYIPLSHPIIITSQKNSNKMITTNVHLCIPFINKKRKKSNKKNCVRCVCLCTDGGFAITFKLFYDCVFLISSISATTFRIVFILSRAIGSARAREHKSIDMAFNCVNSRENNKYKENKKKSISNDLLKII